MMPGVAVAVALSSGGEMITRHRNEASSAVSAVISNLIVGSDDVIEPDQPVNPQPLAASARTTMTVPSV